MLRQDSIQSAELKKKESPFRAKCHEIFCCPLKQVHLKENTEPEGLWHSGSMFCLFGSSPCVSQACCVSQLRSCPLLACPCLGLPRTLRASPGSPGQSWLLLLSGLFVPALSITHCPFFWLPKAACCSSINSQGFWQSHSWSCPLLQGWHSLGVQLVPNTLHSIRLLHSARECSWHCSG